MQTEHFFPCNLVTQSFTLRFVFQCKPHIVIHMERYKPINVKMCFVSFEFLFCYFIKGIHLIKINTFVSKVMYTICISSKVAVTRLDQLIDIQMCLIHALHSLMGTHLFTHVNIGIPRETVHELSAHAQLLYILCLQTQHGTER